MADDKKITTPNVRFGGTFIDRKYKNYAWNGEAKGRYIRYQARAGEEFGGWVFTDEIVVE